MKILGPALALVICVVLAVGVVVSWGSGDELGSARHVRRLPPPVPTMAAEVSLVRGDSVDVLGISRHSLMDGVRRLASARSFAAKVGREAGAEGIGIAGGLVGYQGAGEGQGALGEDGGGGSLGASPEEQAKWQQGVRDVRAKLEARVYCHKCKVYHVAYPKCPEEE